MKEYDNIDEEIYDLFMELINSLDKKAGKNTLN